MNKLARSLTCVAGAVLLATGTSDWHRNAIEELVKRGPERNFDAIRSVSTPLMSSAALLFFIGLAFMIAHIKAMPRAKRALPCILLVLPAAGLTFISLMVGIPGQNAGGGYITPVMLYSAAAGSAVGGFFLLWSLISLGPDKTKR